MFFNSNRSYDISDPEIMGKTLEKYQEEPRAEASKATGVVEEWSFSRVLYGESRVPDPSFMTLKTEKRGFRSA